LIRANIVRRKQHQIVHITPITSIMIDAQLQQQLTHQSPLSARQIWIRRCVRIIDNIGWVLLAMVLTLAAGAVFVFSAFGLYEAIRTEVSILDVVMIIGLVRPLNSTLNGLKKLKQKTINYLMYG
jgi:cell division protein FtsX